MKKMISVLAAGMMVLSLAGCQGGSGSGSTNAAPTKGTYVATVEGFDWGCGTTKVLVTLDGKLESVKADDVIVFETKEATNWAAEGFPVEVSDFARTVEDAYLCDAEGNKTDAASEYVMIELYVSPNDGSPFLYTMATGYNTWCDPYTLNISIGDLQISEGTLKTVVDDVKEDSFTATDGTVYNYAHMDVEGSDTVFVWLHGMGEGGAKELGDATNVKVTELANKVTAYYSDEFQKTTGGASILVPQCPTFWLDMTGAGVSESRLDANDGSSYYTASLKELIDNYAKEVGATKIVLAGCSNGGFMVMNMAVNYPDAWTALVPICEAYKDECLTDEQVAAIKDIPFFFIYSEDDPTVDPTIYEIPTIKRLQEAGASNLVVSTTAHVVDTSGKYVDENGEPHQYSGHWSWIYFDNNEAVSNEDKTTAWDWIAAQTK